MSDFLQQLNTSSLSDEAKTQLAQLYRTIGDSPEFRLALSQAFQVQIDQAATETGIHLSEDSKIQELIEAYQDDVGMLVATLEATVDDQIAQTKKAVYALQPEIDAAMADKIRGDVSV